ncbi:hypothetical protein C8R42DRAFT_639770 [Lentinula raphanica]|nr:hypothetical protein C8R42DRAFT_639770 [Lentinula raphanica]
MNLYRLLLFVTLAVHASSTSVQPSLDADSKNVQNPAPSPAPNIPSPSKPLSKGEESKLPLPGGLGQGRTTGDVKVNADAVKADSNANSEVGDASAITKPGKVFQHSGRLETGSYYPEDTHDPSSKTPNQPTRNRNLKSLATQKARQCWKFIDEHRLACALVMVGAACATGMAVGIEYAVTHYHPPPDCPPGTFGSYDAPGAYSTALIGGGGSEQVCVNATTGVKKKRGVEEKEEGTCRVVPEHESCPCEAATGTVGSNGKIVNLPGGGVNDVKHTKREVVKAVHRKRTTATI